MKKTEINVNLILIETYEGICVDLLEEIKRLIGFEYEIYEAPDGYYGTNSRPFWKRRGEDEWKGEGEGEWSGMIREVMEMKADVGLAALTVMNDRESVVDFTIPFYDHVGIALMMKRGKGDSSSLFSFLHVLDEIAWGSVLAAYLITSLLMWIFDKYSPDSYQNNQEESQEGEMRVFNFRESLWFCLMTLTAQGGGDVPRNWSGQLVAISWWIFSFIVVASYTANLAAFLTINKQGSKVESIEDATQLEEIKRE